MFKSKSIDVKSTGVKSSSHTEYSDTKKPSKQDLNNIETKTSIQPKVSNIIKRVKKENILNTETNNKPTYKETPTNVYILSHNDVGECHYCRHTYNGPGIGIPTNRINLGKNNLQSVIAYQQYVKDKDPECKVLYIVKDCFCTYECAYAQLLTDYIRCNKTKEDTLGYFMEMYNTAYPGKDIKPAGDYRLTKKFGGPLTIEEFRENGSCYKQIRHIACVPDSIEYRFDRK